MGIMMLLSFVLVSCNTSTEQSQYKSSDLQMELARGDVEQIDICEFVSKRGNIVCEVKYTKYYDEKGLLISSTSNFEEKEYLFQALQELEGKRNAIIISRNTDKQITDMSVEDSPGWDSYSWEYDSLGYVKARSASYFEASQTTEYIYNENYELVGENVDFGSHFESANITRKFSDIIYDSHGNWCFRKVTEVSAVEYEESSRIKRSSKIYYELRKIYYRESEIAK
jgi:hypothetical protein